MRLVVMAKHPAVGRVKTRLAAEIGPERATALYRAFLQDLADRLRRLEPTIETWWAHWPPQAPFGDVVARARIFPQRGRDLGARLHGAMERVRSGTSGAVAAIGADAPHIPEEALHACGEALAGGADLVLGPATDGGYYLIGTRTSQPHLFEDMPWGTASVCEVTRARARRARLRVNELPELADVDDLRGLRALVDALHRAPGSLPRTERLLADDPP